MAAYHRVYDSHHLQADCQELGSAPEPYAWQSSADYIFALLQSSSFIYIVQTECGWARLLIGHFVVQSEHLVVGVSNQSVSSVLQGAGIVRDPPAAGILCRPVRHWWLRRRWARIWHCLHQGHAVCTAAAVRRTTRENLQTAHAPPVCILTSIIICLQCWVKNNNDRLTAFDPGQSG